jgi:hypothetical protein
VFIIVFESCKNNLLLNHSWIYKNIIIKIPARKTGSEIFLVVPVWIPLAKSKLTLLMILCRILFK